MYLFIKLPIFELQGVSKHVYSKTFLLKLFKIVLALPCSFFTHLAHSLDDIKVSLPHVLLVSQLDASCFISCKALAAIF